MFKSKYKLVGACALALVITALAVVAPVGAKSQPFGEQAVFQSGIVDTPEADTLVKGEVYIRANRAVKVEIEGVDPTGKTYEVRFIWGPPTAPLGVVTLGSITTDGDGYGVLDTFLPGSVPPFVPTPRIHLRDSDSKIQFVYGF